MKSRPTADRTAYLNFYFQVHQPRRIRPFGFFDIGKDLSFFDDDLNKAIIQRVSRNCYLPANAMFLELIRRFPQIRITFSISGVALEQFRMYAPEVLQSFKDLASTGSVEFLGETYFHSLTFLSDPDEFVAQVKRHQMAMEENLAVSPSIFRNTELIYSDDVGRLVAKLGFKAIYTDGIEKILHRRSPDHLYEHIDGNGLKIFLRNYSLSDDIAFRFSDRTWKEWPLTAAKFMRWLQVNSLSGRLTTLGLDYETFGEHQKAETGIFQFMRKLMSSLATSKHLRTLTPSEAIHLLIPHGRISSLSPLSWADKERDLSAWLGNDLQRDAFDTSNALGRAIAARGDNNLKELWNYLQTSDHFYYMSTKKGDDGKIHNYFSPYSSPYEAFINYMNVLSDLALRLKRMKKSTLIKKRKGRANSLKQKKLLVA
ncbi:MAG TPA: glycoside hydrolase family 57 protein [Chryseosolibacter sp.]|nr:glycoside hydrolase family 57 protein [Chryseosolibacter sp.]